MEKNSQILIQVNNLKKYFPLRKKLFSNKRNYLKAVDGVSFYIKRGETLGLVGESGCGKSTIARTIIGLHDATDGEIMFNGNRIEHLNSKEMMPYRKRMQMIFQDPYTSLNPRMTVREIIGEPLEAHNICGKNERLDLIYSLLEKVGLNKEHANRYPHEFSGGQRQRIGIARALSVNPDLVICDEPISALDVSIQAQIINRLKDLQKEMGITYLFIAHDLSMVRYISDRVGVMYLGNIVEITESDRLYSNPAHPYTRSLLSVIPIPDPKLSENKNTVALEGEVPSPINPPSGCKFRTRCKYAIKKCEEVKPELIEIAKGHMVACHLYNKKK